MLFITSATPCYHSAERSESPGYWEVSDDDEREVERREDQLDLRLHMGPLEARRDGSSWGHSRQGASAAAAAGRNERRQGGDDEDAEEEREEMLELARYRR